MSAVERRMRRLYAGKGLGKTADLLAVAAVGGPPGWETNS